MIGLAANNAFMSNKIEEEDYTALYGYNYALAKDDDGLTLEEAKIIIEIYPSAFEYDAYESLQEALEDKNQQGGLLIVGGASLCVLGFWIDGMGYIADGIFMCFDVKTPPQVPTVKRTPYP